MAYLVDAIGILRVVDVSDRNAPRQIGVLTLPYALRGADLALQGNRLVINAGDVFIVDVTHPAQPQMLTTVDTWGSSAVALSGDYLYVLEDITDEGYCYGANLITVDIHDPSHPVPFDRFPVSSSCGGDMRLLGDRAYVVNYGGLHIFDIANPTLWRELSYLDASGWAISLASSGDKLLAYLIDPNPWQVNAGMFRIADVSDASHPVLLSSMRAFADRAVIVAVGDYVYLADWTDGLLIFRVTGLETHTANQ